MNDGDAIHFNAGLLAVDLGLKTGLAHFQHDGRLKWYRSQHFPDPASLRRAVPQLLQLHDDVTHVCIEGGGRLSDIWIREADRRGITVITVSPETWRQRFMYPRQQRNGRMAKRNADTLARSVIDWSKAARPTTLRHDAAEAILIGLWAVLEIGWLPRLPPELKAQLKGGI